MNAIVNTNVRESVTTGSSTKVKTIGVTSISFHVAGRFFTWDFRVMKDLSFNTILGVDFQKKYKTILNMGNGTYSFWYDKENEFNINKQEYLCALQGLNDSQEQEFQILLGTFSDVLND